MVIMLVRLMFLSVDAGLLSRTRGPHSILVRRDFRYLRALLQGNLRKGPETDAHYSFGFLSHKEGYRLMPKSRSAPRPHPALSKL